MYLRYNDNEPRDMIVDVPMEKNNNTKPKKKNTLELYIEIICMLYGLNYMESHPEIFDKHLGLIVVAFFVLLFITKLIERPKK